MSTPSKSRNRLSIYLKATPDDIKLSGPIVWPNISGDLPVDRYIHRRPELAYLQALRTHQKIRVNNNEPDLANIRVDILRITLAGSRKRHQTIGHFTHRIDDNALEDVRALLKKLRSLLSRSMPDQPIFTCSVGLRFFDSDKPRARHQTSFQDRWL